MANILILGDTWGITPCHIWPHSKEPADWFEFQFLKKGHPTFNKSWGGNQNHYQLAQAEVFLNATKDTQLEIDLIIWFHSELMRDLGEGTPKEKQDEMFEEFGFDNSKDFDIFESILEDENEDDWEDDVDYINDEDNLISFLNEYYVVYPKKIPKAEYK
jgi:hypothetical protein